MKNTSMTYQNKDFEPQYEHMHPWEVYAFDLMTEYEQCKEEGLKVERWYGQNQRLCGQDHETRALRRKYGN